MFLKDTPKILKMIYVGEKRRITSDLFTVYIPSLMPLIKKDKPKSEPINNSLDRLVSKNDSITGSINNFNYITAKSLTYYRYSHGNGDGVKLAAHIPNSTIEKIEGKKFDNSKTSGQTELGGPGPHLHTIKMPLTAYDPSISEIKTTEHLIPLIDNLNARWIEDGHILYGFLVDGTDNEFVVTHIEGMTPYHD